MQLLLSSSIALTLLGLVLGNLSLKVPQETSNAVNLKQVSIANDEFDAHLLQSLEHQAGGKNVFVSAFSISTALAMLISGAVNSTYTEIYNSLRFSKSHFTNSDLLNAFKVLLHEINHPAKETKNVLNVANAIAIQKKKQILESFLSNVVNNFNAKVMVEDFALNGQKATDELNHWVNEKTRGKIPKLFDKKLDSKTIMVLLNAIYFKGTWEHTFSAKLTQNEPFYLTREHSESVPLMQQHARFNYGHFDDGQMLEIPYMNHSMSMYIFLPRDNHSQAISKTLSTTTLAARISQLHSTEVILRLPKFKFQDTYMLASTLKKLGMIAAFSAGTADFSNIDGTRDLFVSEVVHKTFIDVNEEGSEAAAATGVVVVHSNSIHPRPTPVDFRVNRPFMFFIRNNQQQLTLFSGLIKKPEYK